MDAIALSTILQRMSEEIEDYIAVATTTNITTNNSIVSTALKAYGSGNDDDFIDYWVWLNTTNNANVERKISDYAYSTGTLTILGSALAAESASQTVYIYKYKRSDKLNAINRALEELSDRFYQFIDNRTLVTNNWLPNGHFDDQATGGTPDGYTLTNVTGAAETTLIWGGAKSVKLTDSGAGGGYMSLSSDTERRLLDLMNKTVSLRVMALPQNADDAWIKITTKDKSGATQTLTSTTTCQAGEYTMLELEDQQLNDNLVEVVIYFGITTASKYCYFDNATLTGHDLREYLLPTDLQDGVISSVWEQETGEYDPICYDIQPVFPVQRTDWDVVASGVNKYIKFSDYSNPAHQIRIRGRKPHTALSTDAGTINMDNQDLPAFVAYALHKMFSIKKGLVANIDITRARELSIEYLYQYNRLTNKNRPGKSFKLRV